MSEPDKSPYPDAPYDMPKRIFRCAGEGCRLHVGRGSFQQRDGAEFVVRRSQIQSGLKLTDEGRWVPGKRAEKRFRTRRGTAVSTTDLFFGKLARRQPAEAGVTNTVDLPVLVTCMGCRQVQWLRPLRFAEPHRGDSAHGEMPDHVSAPLVKFRVADEDSDPATVFTPDMTWPRRD